MSTNRMPGAGREAPTAPDFDPVPLRYRRDGWTPERQVAFIRAVAECGVVAEACKRVGMSTESAYELARRPDAQSFRIAWDCAMDQAVRRAGDAAIARSINGIDIPHYYRGELVGTHKRYDERLTMFVLQRRDPLRFGRHLEEGVPVGSREDKALRLADALAWTRSDARRDELGRPRAVFAAVGAANDDEDEPVCHRPSPHVYDYAPPPEDLYADEPDEADEGDEGDEACDEERLEDHDEEDLAVAAAAIEELTAERLAADHDDDGDARPNLWEAVEARVEAARAARRGGAAAAFPAGPPADAAAVPLPGGERPVPPDASPTSSTSEVQAAGGGPPGPEPRPAHPQLPRAGRLAGESASATESQ